MRKILFIFLALILVALPLWAACAPAEEAPPAPAPAPTPPPEPIELTYSNFFPPTHLHSILAEKWIEEISARTDGRVVVTYYPGGALVGAKEMYDGVVQGITDIGMCLFAYTPGRFPACELVDLPHGYPNGWVATKVANDFYKEFKPAELEDVHPLYFHAHGPGVIFTTKKPVYKLEDLEGLVLRSTGVGAKIVGKLGGEGYGAGQGDAYELMSKGTIDGSFTPREVLLGWKQAEVVKYVTGCYDVGNTTMMFIIMNNDKWDALPEDIKTIFTEVNEEWIEKHAKVWDYYDKVAMDFFFTFEGRDLIELSPEEMARWVEVAVTPLIEEYITDKTAMGLPAAEYQEYILERVAYWSDKAPSAYECVAWVETELK